MFNISVIVNTFAVIIGSSLGLIFGKKLNENLKTIMFQSVGVVTLIIGFGMGFEADNLIVVLISMVIGGVIGEVLKIERRIGNIANKIEKSKGETVFVKGFITATVLFLVGPMTIIGCLNAGIAGDNSVIYLKSALDFISSIILSSIYGIGVMFSFISVYLIQGLLVTGSGYLNFLSKPEYLNDFTAVGGAMLIALGIRVLEVKEIKVGNFLPALIIVIIINYFLINLL